jgi:CO/xanthine dehydrogenase Mo-binding subunit
LGRPVKLVATRDQGFAIWGHRHETKHRIRIGASRDGRFTAYHHDQWKLNGRADPYVNGGVENAAAMYAFPAVMSTGRMVRADRDPPIFMRSPAEMPVIFVLESAVDELAVKLAMAPVELRRIKDTERSWVTGKPYSSRSLMACYDAASAAFGWKQHSPQPGSMRDGAWLIGWGSPPPPTRRCRRPPWPVCDCRPIHHQNVGKLEARRTSACGRPATAGSRSCEPQTGQSGCRLERQQSGVELVCLSTRPQPVAVLGPVLNSTCQ